MLRQVHVGGCREGCGGTGRHMQVTVVNTSRKKKEKLTYWQRQAGMGTGRQMCIGRSGHGARSMGMPRQAHVSGHREGCGGTGGCMQVTIMNTSRKKEEENLPTGTDRQA